MGLLIEQALNEGFLQIRYYGLYSRRKKGLIAKIFDAIERFKKFKESLDPYISRVKCKECGSNMVLDWELTQIIREEFQNMDDKPLGSRLTHLKTKFKGPPIASKTNPLVKYIRTKICRIAHVGELLQRFA
jgi:hypothetical protein